MAKSVGSWWIRDTIDGRRLEAEGFASTLGGLSEFDWTRNHGESDVKESDFRVIANTTQRSDQVDAMQMSSHGWQDGFLVWGGSVDTSEASTSARTTSRSSRRTPAICCTTGPTTRWGAGSRRSSGCTTCGFHNSSYSGGGQNSRGTWFAMYSAWLYYWSGSWLFRVDMPVREAWAEANEIVEGSSVQWAYLRAESPDAPTYNERLRVAESTDPVSNRSFWIARGTC